MSVHHFFIPHKDTHKKAHLITWHAMAVYLLLFIIMQSAFSIIGFSHPGVLGTTSSISIQQIIALTNQERQKEGLSPLSENTNLDQAAASKAANMFTENYWAHFAPSGKSPWDFISSSGYKFTFAGENLAKSFTSADDVVKAWMNSPLHKKNIMDPRFRDIGIAVEDGILDGNRTTLVVQMFGTTPSQFASAPQSAPKPLAAAINNPSPIPTIAPTIVPISNVGGEATNVPLVDLSAAKNLATPPLFDPFMVSKIVGLILVSMIGILLMADYLVLKRRGVYRVASLHVAHLTIIAVAFITLLTAHSGGII
jgi:hypothetical protein